ncbi:hypothetical protein [Sphingomonas jaspsi]|uniref:hypothetical protein n=1 Tax=Sphingomonas jaspsi TaxID=392409 RepID=UPI0012EC83E0|nr:hypothetical protein [Sphingomonas jaspsi]
MPTIKPPPAQGKAVSFNGWQFSSRPTVPYQKVFVLKLQGMRWYLQDNGMFNMSVDPHFNARRLELFYEENGTWDNFDFPHPHLGMLRCRFKEPVEIPAAVPNSNGFIDAFEITLVHHNPGF